MNVVLARVDNRLIHGQVLESWIPAMKTSVILVVDDSVADDSLRQAIMEIAVPPRIQCKFIHVRDLKSFLDGDISERERIMILFSEIRDAREAINDGAQLTRLNIGNVHYEQGKRRITPSVSLNDEEICWLDEIDRRIPIDIRATPDDPKVPFTDIIDGKGGAAVCYPQNSRWWEKWPFSILRR